MTLFAKLKAHAGHEVEIAAYGPKPSDTWNVSLECITCGEVIVDRDAPGRREEVL